MLDYFYFDGHLTNPVLIIILCVGLFFIIRFIELIDNYGYIDGICEKPYCKKCHVPLTLINHCRHGSYSIFQVLIPVSYTAILFGVWSAYLAPYLKSVIVAAPEQVFNAAGIKIQYGYGLQRVYNHIMNQSDQIAYYYNGTQVTHKISPIEIFITDIVNIIMGVFV